MRVLRFMLADAECRKVLTLALAIGLFDAGIGLIVWPHGGMRPAIVLFIVNFSYGAYMLVKLRKLYEGSAACHRKHG